MPTPICKVSIPPREKPCLLNFNEASAPSCLQFGLLPDDDFGADGHALVKVSNIGVDQPEAAGGNGSADRVGPIGAVNAIHGGAEIHCPSPERVAGTTGHEAR